MIINIDEYLEREAQEEQAADWERISYDEENYWIYDSIYYAGDLN